MCLSFVYPCVHGLCSVHQGRSAASGNARDICRIFFFASICRIYIRSTTLESLPFETRVQALSYYWATSLAKARPLDPDDASIKPSFRSLADNAPGLFARAGRFGHWRAPLPAPSSTGAARSSLHDLIRVQPQPSVLGLYLQSSASERNGRGRLVMDVHDHASSSCRRDSSGHGPVNDRQRQLVGECGGDTNEEVLELAPSNFLCSSTQVCKDAMTWPS